MGVGSTVGSGAARAWGGNAWNGNATLDETYDLTLGDVLEPTSDSSGSGAGALDGCGGGGGC